MKKTYLIIAAALLLIGVVSSAGVWKIPSGTAEAGMVIWSGTTGGESGGEIGFTDIGGTTQVKTSQYIYFSSATPTTEGDVRYGHLYVADSNDETFAIRLYNSSGNAVLCCTGTIADDTPGWINCDAGESYSVVDAANYGVSLQGDGGFKIGDGNGEVRYFNTGWDGGGGVCPAQTDPISDQGLTTSGGAIAIIWNNTPGDPE